MQSLDERVTQVMHEIWRLAETPEGRSSTHSYIKRIILESASKRLAHEADAERARASEVDLVVARRTRFWLDRTHYTCEKGQWCAKANGLSGRGSHPHEALQQLAMRLERWWADPTGAEEPEGPNGTPSEHWRSAAGVLHFNALREAQARQCCGGCGVLEGEFHAFGCDLECCPFCGGQLSSCSCPYRHFYPGYDFTKPQSGLPQEVYEEGLPEDVQKQWSELLEAKGHIPFILYSNLCARCGKKWPEMFRVPDKEWARYIEPAQRDKMICLECYTWIKQVVDKATSERQGHPISQPAEGE